jgi:hypothetical protein
MKLLFVYWAFEDQGSGLVIQGYTEAARALGHEVSVYGRWIDGKPNPNIPLNYSLNIDSADAVVFIFEWTTELKPGDHLDLARLVGRIPRRRRVILDGDGNYNDPICVNGDYNHRNIESSRGWTEICDSLSDKICQPTLHPLRGNVLPFLFYAYSPSWVAPLDLSASDYSMLYVGHSKFRWHPMQRVLRAVEPVRGQLGRIGLVGHGWAGPPHWAAEMQLQETYYTDPCYLRKLDVEFLPPVPFPEVIDWMGKAFFNPVLLRPTFERMQLVNPRMFETPAANTIPLFGMGEAQVREIYGEAGLELWLPDRCGHEKILDMVNRPDHYSNLLENLREHLAEKHSHAARLRQLIEIVET